MTNSQPNQPKPPKKSLKERDPEKYARLMAEAKAPYKGLRKVFYGVFAASGMIGAMLFSLKLATGADIVNNLGNFAFQMGVVALMIWLFRLESR